MSEDQDAIAKNDEGVRLLNAGDFEGAVAAFSAAITLDPDFEAAYRNRANALHRLGRYQEAQADSDKAESAKTVGPDEPAHTEAQRNRSRSKLSSIHIISPLFRCFLFDS